MISLVVAGSGCWYHVMLMASRTTDSVRTSGAIHRLTRRWLFVADADGSFMPLPWFWSFIKLTVGQALTQAHQKSTHAPAEGAARGDHGRSPGMFLTSVRPRNRCSAPA